MAANDNPQGTLSDGRKVVTTAGTPVQLSSLSTEASWIQVVAEADNTGVITVGASTVVAALATRRGVPLEAGDSEVLPLDNLTDVWIDSTVNGDGVTFVYGK